MRSSQLVTGAAARSIRFERKRRWNGTPISGPRRSVAIWATVGSVRLTRTRAALRLSFNAHEVALARMPSLEDALKSAEDGRLSFDDRFEAGDAKLLDLLGVEDQLFQAAGGVVSGRSAVLLSHFQVLGAMGRLRSSL